MKKQKKEKIFKILKRILTIVLFVIIGVVIWQLMPLMKDISTQEGQVAFKEKIDGLGFKGFLLLSGLQILQILLVVLPGEPFEVLAGMCYGAWGGALFITAWVFVTTSIIFYTVRKYGKKYLYNFFSKERIDKIEKNKLLKNPRTLDIILCVLFMMPASPKDLMVYLGGLLPIKPLKFILISSFVRFPSVITSTIVGANLSKGDWKTSLIIYLIVLIITGIILWVIQRRDKNKDFEKILKQ